MTDRLTRVTTRITHGKSTAEERRRWLEELPDFLPPIPGPRHVFEQGIAARFLILCDHLAQNVETTEEHQLLVHALVASQRDLIWADPLLEELDALLEETIDRLYELLAAEFASSTDPADAVAVYLRLRDHCFGIDERIVALVAPSPHISGLRIMTDYGETVAETALPSMLRKLEDEGELDLLHAIIGYDTSDARDLLALLKNPDRFVDHILDTSIERGEEIPLWIWFSEIPLERFDLLRSRVPWTSIENNADRVLWAHIEAHVHRELGEDPEHWETFRVLEHGFAGTLDELIDVSRRL